MKINFFCGLAMIGVVACGGKEPAPATANEAQPTTAAAGAARPSCDAIDEACDPYETEPGLSHECHELGEATSSTEAQCAAKKAECLAACPKK